MHSQYSGGALRETDGQRGDKAHRESRSSPSSSSFSYLRDRQKGGKTRQDTL